MNIVADSVSVVVAGRQILQSESLVCSPGRLTGLVGPSGCGKTTLLHCLGLLQIPTTGQILVEGEDATGWRSGRRRRFWAQQSAFVLQDYGVMEEEAVSFNVTMTKPLWRRVHSESNEKLQPVLAATGLAGRQDEVAARLSGGEKQRLSIARAMYKNARVVLVDEPTASLDASNRSKVIDLFATLARRDCTVIVATHDAEMMDACDVTHVVGAPSTEPAISAPTSPQLAERAT